MQNEHRHSLRAPVSLDPRKKQGLPRSLLYVECVAFARLYRSGDFHRGNEGLHLAAHQAGAQQQ